MNYQGLSWLLVLLSGVCSGDATKCYEELGCFPTSSPWFSWFKRPFPAPMSPTEIKTKITCFTSAKPLERFNITLWPSISLNGLPFQPEWTTVFITHGFASSAEEPWVHNMKDAYAQAKDANVCLVDWSSGAGMLNYFQVASNTRVVGAEVARFVRFLQSESGLKTSNLHLIGHSLGSHISSYVAKNFTGVARITGCDVAQPGFEDADKEVRLDQGDADFVEAIHTNGAALIPFRGMGFVNPVGHVDFYMNGGRRQPGCKLLDVATTGFKLLGLTSLADFTVETLVSWTSCNHGRSFEFFTEALKGNCPIWGLASTMRTFKLLGNTKVKVTADSCTADSCIPLGLFTPQFPARGVFSTTTPSSSPYCSSEKENTKIVSRLLTDKSLPESVSEILTKFFKST